MSSPLDGRIRALAREEAAALLGVGTPDSGGTDQVAELRQELTAAHERIGQLLTGLDELAARVQTLEDGARGGAKSTARQRRTAE